MEISPELRAAIARKLDLLVRLEEKVAAIHGKDWETKPHPKCRVVAVYSNLLKEVNKIADELEKK